MADLTPQDFDPAGFDANYPADDRVEQGAGLLLVSKGRTVNRAVCASL